jgi:hypothetical protein
MSTKQTKETSKRERERESKSSFKNNTIRYMLPILVGGLYE